MIRSLCSRPYNVFASTLLSPKTLDRTFNYVTNKYFSNTKFQIHSELQRSPLRPRMGPSWPNVWARTNMVSPTTTLVAARRKFWRKTTINHKNTTWRVDGWREPPPITSNVNIHPQKSKATHAQEMLVATQLHQRWSGLCLTMRGGDNLVSDADVWLPQTSTDASQAERIAHRLRIVVNLSVRSHHWVAPSSPVVPGSWKYRSNFFGGMLCGDVTIPILH